MPSYSYQGQPSANWLLAGIAWCSGFETIPKAVWNFSENSSVLEGVGFPYLLEQLSLSECAEFTASCLSDSHFKHAVQRWQAYYLLAWHHFPLKPECILCLSYQ